MVISVIISGCFMICWFWNLNSSISVSSRVDSDSGFSC